MVRKYSIHRQAGRGMRLCSGAVNLSDSRVERIGLLSSKSLIARSRNSDFGRESGRFFLKLTVPIDRLRWRMNIDEGRVWASSPTCRIKLSSYITQMCDVLARGTGLQGIVQSAIRSDHHTVPQDG